jgi:hypothetical protein
VNDAHAELRQFNLAELELIERFLSCALDNQHRHASRLRDGSS